VFISRLEIFVHNVMFLSTFSRKLHEHLNMFIQIGHVSCHLLNMFLGIFVTILLIFTQPTKITSKSKNQTLLFPISTKINQTLKKILNPTKPLTFIISNPNKIIQTLINTIKPQLQTSKLRYSQTQIKPKSDLKSTLSNPKSFKRQTEIENPNLKIQIRSRQINTFKPQIFQTSNFNT
jgi:hypothetical protein